MGYLGYGTWFSVESCLNGKKDLLKEVQAILSQVQLRRNQYDKKFWCFHSSNEFSSKTFTEEVIKQ